MYHVYLKVSSGAIEACKLLLRRWKAPSFSFQEKLRNYCMSVFKKNKNTRNQGDLPWFTVVLGELAWIQDLLLLFYLVSYAFLILQVLPLSSCWCYTVERQNICCNHQKLIASVIKAGSTRPVCICLWVCSKLVSCAARKWFMLHCFGAKCS